MGESRDVGEKHSDVLDPARPHLAFCFEFSRDAGGQDDLQQVVRAIPLALDGGEVSSFAVTETLRLETGGDASLQQDRIERLGQVVLGTERDRVSDL